ncbi:MAG TPA: hypothetical protein VHB25_09750 [Gemmatimonadaceae bacterium]|nr:hypothetical protein [Gemmatimonadaceae bacterium]
MSAPQALVHLLKPWADYYSDSKGAETIVQFLHIGGLLLAGGLAIAADRGTYRAMRFEDTDRRSHLREVAAVHRWVLTGLAVVIISGIALFASDVDTFFGSWIFWTKMGLVVLLLINGLVMTRAEAGLAVDPSASSPHWKQMHRAAVTSLTLWFIITAFGVALVNLA